MLRSYSPDEPAREKAYRKLADRIRTTEDVLSYLFTILADLRERTALIEAALKLPRRNENLEDRWLCEQRALHKHQDGDADANPNSFTLDQLRN